MYSRLGRHALDGRRPPRRSPLPLLAAMWPEVEERDRRFWRICRVVARRKVHNRHLSPMDLSADACAALFERIRLGDAAAEEELVQSFGGKVFAMAVARTRDREASRDLVQDVMWAVLQGLRGGQLRAPDKLAAFVSGTARNLINNYFRTRTRAVRDVRHTPSRWMTDPSHSIEDQERTQLVRRAVSELESDDRRILMLTLVEGLTPGEIASRLRLSPEVVRQRKSRAIKKVIAMLAERSRP